jgi:hypothetical protein
MVNHPNRSKTALRSGVVKITRTASRTFKNEFGREIAIFVRAGQPGKNVFCRTIMVGHASTARNNMTRLELENLRDAIIEALSPEPPATFSED